MFFLLRCVFWLAIVFHAMNWPQETAPAQGAAGSVQDQMFKTAASMAGDLAASAGTMAVAKLEEGCVKRLTDCVASAARLPQIVATAPAADVIPPKRPVRLAESESGRLAGVHKPPAQHN